MTNLDPFTLIGDLEQAGFDRPQAEAIIKVSMNRDDTHLATKSDIAELKADIFRQLWIMGIGITALVVTLIKLIP